ncbi:hypothetical protein GT755_12495 [Herbidospora sp. NEAU-GS84]|uniref:Uncharacterized protein n=1 Tax=Herbidospora solisilvae TaxID=2696284 RepID=A0A7C9J284_9ACTN|nr:hypothetical protein [Herbidospora solisilvae]NAS22502.1 hypothetical protein [Herbidospora solisilvae]
MTKLSPAARRRLDNLAQFWNSRLQGVTSDAALAQVCFDRARAAARRAQRAGDQQAMHELATLLATWAEQRERAEIARHAA